MDKDNHTQQYEDTVRTFLTLYRYLRQYSRQMHSVGISGRKIAALRYLLESGPRTVGQLRDYLYVNDSSTSELISQLDKAGLVTRTRSESDNRVVMVAITPAGQVIAEITPLGGIPLLRERLRTIPAERLAVMQAILQEIADLLGVSDES